MLQGEFLEAEGHSRLSTWQLPRRRGCGWEGIVTSLALVLQEVCGRPVRTRHVIGVNLLSLMLP
jgi:hypothetical protein